MRVEIKIEPVRASRRDGVTKLDADVLSLDPTQSTEPTPERGRHRLTSPIILSAGDQRADASDALPLLRPHCERPRRRAAQPRDEFAPSHR
jgi:hypothetical protein